MITDAKVVRKRWDNLWDTGPISVSCLIVCLTALTLLYETPREGFLNNMCLRKVSSQEITYKRNEIRCEVQNMYLY